MSTVTAAQAGADPRPARVLTGWVLAALEGYGTWVAGKPVGNVAAMGPLAQTLADDSRYRPDGPAQLHGLLDRVLSTLAAAEPMPRVANPPSLIAERARLMFGLDSFPLSANRAITVKPAAGDSDKTPRNQLSMLLQANAHQVANDVSNRLQVGDLWVAAHRTQSHQSQQALPLESWQQWPTPPRVQPVNTDALISVPPTPMERKWPEEAARELLIKMAEQPCRCLTRLQLRRTGKAPHQHVEATTDRVNVDLDAFLATIYAMAARAGLEYLRTGIANGVGLAQRAHQQLHTGRKDPRGLAAAISAERDLFEHQKDWSKHGLLYRPTPASTDVPGRANQDTARRIVTAVLQVQLFRVVTVRRHQLHQELAALADPGALIRAARLPSAVVRSTPVAHVGDVSVVADLRVIAAACRTIKGRDGRLSLIRQWLSVARPWQPTNGHEVIELAVMVEQLDWDLVGFGLEPEVQALRQRVWATLDAALSAVDDAAAAAVVNVLRSHRHRGSAVIATKRRQHDQALAEGRNGIIELRRSWESAPRHTPPELAIDLMQQSVLAFAGHWTKLAEQTLCAADKSNGGFPLAVVLRAALMWGWQSIGWLDAVIASDTTLPSTRWADSGRLAIPSWQLQPRSIAVRGMVATKLALAAGLIDQRGLERARDLLIDQGLEPDFTRLPGTSPSLDLYEPADIGTLLSSTAPSRVLQSMLDCPAVDHEHRGTLLQTALLVRTVVGDSEDMPALVLPNDEEAAHPVLGDIPVLWRSPMPSFRAFQPTLVEYAEALDILDGGRWNIGWLGNAPVRGMFLSSLGRDHKRPELAQAIIEMLRRSDPAAAATRVWVQT